MAKTVKVQSQSQPQEEVAITQEATPIENIEEQPQEQPKEENIETPVVEATITPNANVEPIKTIEEPIVVAEEPIVVVPSSTPYYDELKSNKFKLVGGQYVPNY